MIIDGMFGNVITFDLLEECFMIEAGTWKSSCGRVHTILLNDAEEIWKQNPGLGDVKELFYSISDNPREIAGITFNLSVRMTPGSDLSKRIIERVLYKYFREKATVRYSIPCGLEVWVENRERDFKNVRAYDRFSVMPTFDSIVNGWQLVISFNGTSYVYTVPVSFLDLHNHDCDLVIWHEVLRKSLLTSEQKQCITSAFPVINRALAKEFDLTIREPEIHNRYALVKNRIQAFVNEYLCGRVIENKIRITSCSLLEVPQEKIFRLPPSSNLLAFGMGKTGASPLTGVFGDTQDSGPYLPSPHPDVMFFFISRSADKEICKQLYYIMTSGSRRPDGVKEFPSLGESVRQPFNTLRGLSIFFDQDITSRTNQDRNIRSALNHIERKLDSRWYNPKVRHVAIFINPAGDTDRYNPINKMYFRLMEILLGKGIMPQSVLRERIRSVNFTPTLIDVSTEILAKIDGRPWALPEEPERGDIVFGLSEIRREEKQNKPIDVICEFTESGIFKNCLSIPDGSVDKIMFYIRGAITRHVFARKQVGRIFIHSSSCIDRQKMDTITKMLMSLRFDIELYIVFVSRTETRDYVVFDDGDRNLMPHDGTYVRLRSNHFLLYNNSRFEGSTDGTIRFPIKLRILKYAKRTGMARQELSPEEAREIMNQIHRFSRLYWKTVRQQPLPVTVLYPELIAEYARQFKHHYIPDFSRDTMWFL